MINSAIDKVTNIFQYGETVVNAVKKSSFLNNLASLYTICLDYKKQAEELAEKALYAKDCITLIASEAPALFQSLKQSNRKTAKVVEKHLAQAPNEEGFLQLIAQEVSYQDWAAGTPLPVSSHFNCPTYRVQEQIRFAGGISGVVLVAENQAPIVALRGTDPSNYMNLRDDLQENIGSLNCTRYAGELEALLVRVAAEHGRIHIMGHSYGGTVAQRLTVAHPQLIQRCTFHNAPGVGKRMVDEYRKNLAKLPPDYPPPSVWSYRHAKDIVSYLGGDHLPTDQGCDFTASTHNDPISHIEAHAANTILDRKQLFVGKLASDSLKQCAAYIETLRRKAAH